MLVFAFLYAETYTQIMNEKYASLIHTVQHNSHIADARHAGNFTLCVYLLKMREFYRWEQNIDYQKELTNDDVGDWLVQREGLWDDVEDEAFKSLVIDGVDYDPFDSEAINAILHDKKLVYSAGLGNQCRPHFFIAQLEQKIQQDDYTILISNKEYARDIASPPAMQQGNTIYIRRESLRQILWEKVDEWRWIRTDSPLGRSIGYYDFDSNIETALDDMLNAEMKMVIAHEIGEVMAGKEWGEPWQDMLASLPRSKAEIMLRAIRDHYADAVSTLPALIKLGNPASIHFYFANMTAMRKELAPTLMEAYDVWHSKGSLYQLDALIPRLLEHWQSLAKNLLKLHLGQEKNIEAGIESLVNKSYF